MSKPDALSQMASAEQFDVLVIGGGINGAGILREAVLRGLRAALVEQGDFAGATSSATTKLAHGGLRYLEQFDLGLVHESLVERSHLLATAPHLVQPLDFILPVFRGRGRPLWQVCVGLELYHRLAGRYDLDRPRRLSVTGVLDRLPGLQGRGLAGGVEYREALMDDARLCIECLLDAAAHGACIASRARACALIQDGPRLVQATVEEGDTGQRHAVRARVFVAAAGPWTDRVWDLFDPAHQPVLQPSRGVHLVLPGTIAPRAVALQHPRDGRLFFLLPWLGHTLVGTTETEEAGPETRAEADAEETEYLCEAVAAYFPGRTDGATPLSSLAGIRPLVRQPGRRAGSTSRRELIHADPARFVAVAGGKYTTFRRVAERVVDRVERLLGRHPRPAGTQARSLPGAQGDRTAARQAADRVLGAMAWPGLVDHLVSRYGTRAAAAAAVIAREPRLAQRLHPGHHESFGEALFAREQEWAAESADFLLRRTRLGLLVRSDERTAIQAALAASKIYPC